MFRSIRLQMRRIAPILAFTCLSGVAVDQPVDAQTAVHVTVNTRVTGARVTPIALGMNTAVWDGKLRDDAVPIRMRELGVTMLRYPGGSTSDGYNWKDNANAGGKRDKFDAANNFDGFMKVAKATGARPIIIVNYGTNSAGPGGGDPNEAAAWVEYANRVKHYNAMYWEIGNEIYGNGEYGASWEDDYHSLLDKQSPQRKGSADLGPTAYGRNFNAFVAAMKAKDPTIKIGAILTAPGNWPDGAAPDWNTNVLQQCGRNLDFVSIHVYPQNPGKESDAGLLAGTDSAAATIAKLRPLLMQYCHRAVPIFLTEYNSVSSNPGKQSVSLVNGLFAADNTLAWLENGVTNVDWWALHNGASKGNTSAALYGDADFGDYGVLSNGDGNQPVNTPFPSYYGLRMASLVARPGSVFVAAKSDQPVLSVHAARRPDGTIGVMLVNRSPDTIARVTITLKGARLASKGTSYNYGKDTGGAITSNAVEVQGNKLVVTVHGYTVMDLVIGAGR